jgi:hypothetical protein
MAYSVVAHTIGGSPTSGIDTTGADLIVVVEGCTAFGTFSDSKSNTWTALSDWTASGDAVLLRCRYCQAPTVGSGHTFSSSGGLQTTLSVIALSGSVGTPLDQQNFMASQGTPVQPGSITPGANNEVLITAGAGYVGGSDFTAIDSGFTISDHASFGTFGVSQGMAYLIQTTATSENPTWTGATFNNGCGIASFKASGGGGGGHGLFLPSLLNGISTGGPFFPNPIGKHRIQRVTLRKAA